MKLPDAELWPTAAKKEMDTPPQCVRLRLQRASQLVTVDIMGPIPLQALGY